VKVEQPLCKFVAAGQADPAPLHVEGFLFEGRVVGLFSLEPGLFCAQVALGNFVGQLVKHNTLHRPPDPRSLSYSL
jgi:hypothetical protein